MASRAILGEWLGGSGGGWQDSGGLWPGIKVITGRTALPKDPEYGVIKGCLLPEHNLLSIEEIPMADKREYCPSCDRKYSSVNFPLYKCDNCQTVTCQVCKKGYTLCQVCRKGKNRKIR